MRFINLLQLTISVPLQTISMNISFYLFFMTWRYNHEVKYMNEDAKFTVLT